MRDICKSVFFIQDLNFLESGRFILWEKGLKKAVAKEELSVLNMDEQPGDCELIRFLLGCYAADWRTAFAYRWNLKIRD